MTEKRYSKRSIMMNAWKAFRTGKIESFGKALKQAWRNAKLVLAAKMAAGVKEETRTWYGWKASGLEVIHESKALFQVIIEDVKTKSGTRVLSYFGLSQTTDQPQEPKVA